MPFEVADYVDFYSSLHHATNLGPDVPARRRAAAPELAPPAGGLPRAGRDRGAERDAGAAAERPAPRRRVRPERAARHRAGGGLRDRHAEHHGRAGADRAGARPRVRDGARERLVGARHPGLGVPAARAVPRQVVRHLGEPLGGSARRAGRPARAGRAAGAGAAAVPRGGAVGLRHPAGGRAERRGDRALERPPPVLVDRAADRAPDRERREPAHRRPARHRARSRAPSATSAAA